MKILMVHPHDISSPREPWTVRVTALAVALKREGHEVTLAYTSLDMDESKHRVALDGIERIVLSRRGGPAALCKNVRRLWRAASRADIIHFQKCFSYAALPAVLCAWFFDKHLHYDWDDWEEKIWYHSNKKSVHTELFGAFLRLMEQALPKIADTVSVASDALFEIALRLGVSRERLFKIPVGADPEKFENHAQRAVEIRLRYAVEGPLVLYVGQLHGGQYVEQFIGAAACAASAAENATFMVVGDGWRRCALEALAADFKLSSRMIFTGAVPHDEIPAFMAAADVCVACFEDNEVTRCKSPLKIVEYMAAARPIVASDVGEVRKMVGEAGLLVRPSDDKSLVEAILLLLKDREFARRLGRQAGERARRMYSWDRSSSVLLSAYEKRKLVPKNTDA